MGPHDSTPGCVSKRTKSRVFQGHLGTSLVAQMVKYLPSMQETRVRSLGWSGRSPGGGHGNPLQYSCLENPKDRGAWRATVHGVAESDKTEQLTHTGDPVVKNPPSKAGCVNLTLGRGIETPHVWGQLSLCPVTREVCVLQRRPRATRTRENHL